VTEELIFQCCFCWCCRRNTAL